MKKQFLRILDLGQENFWQLIQDVDKISSKPSEQIQIWENNIQKSSIHLWIGKRNEQEKNDFLSLLKEVNINYIEHDCSNMDLEALENIKLDLSPLQVLHISCGFNETELYTLSESLGGSCFNGLSEHSCPWAALAEACFNYQQSDFIDKWRICWIGNVSPIAQSLMEAAIYMPYEFFLGIPSWSKPEYVSTDMALKAGAKIFMSHEPQLALDEANIMYIDDALESVKSSKPIPINFTNDNFIWERGFILNDKFLGLAKENALIVSTKINANYAKADTSLQENRRKLYKHMLMATLNHIL